MGKRKLHTSLHICGKKRFRMVEDGQLETEEDEGKY
jgi:hypothetical protein